MVMNSIARKLWRKLVDLIRVFSSYLQPALCFFFRMESRETVCGKVEKIDFETEEESFSPFSKSTFSGKVCDCEKEEVEEEEEEEQNGFTFSFPKYENACFLAADAAAENGFDSNLEVETVSFDPNFSKAGSDSSEFDDRISSNVSSRHYLSDSDSTSSDEGMENDYYYESSMGKKQMIVENSFSESNSTIFSESSSSELEEEQEDDYSNSNDTSEITASDNHRTGSSEEVEVEEGEEELESLWEHQDLIEQLKIEIKKVRATGLPTILEDESESVRAFDDLRPWKMDEFRRGDCSSSSSIGEVHKFYRSYRERMRKFDVMNYQKMYAIGFLQLKDPLKTMASTQKQSSSIFRRNRIHGADPRTKKFMEELQSDLETIYVGQMCLSWEFLHWQYQKALDLFSRDGDDGKPTTAQRRRRSSCYNEVAGEFQQFQVLLQRFVEDEPFRPPRLQNYVENRCLFRNLLQVPVIREDNFKDRRKNWSRDGDESAITGEMLVAILEESIRIFWQFVRTDRYSSALLRSIVKRRGSNISEQHHRLLVDAMKIIQKKEKKLKEILRSDACILKKLRRWGREDEEDSDDLVLCFFSQVDMKLVTRVLNMSRITMEQLVWCHSKLSKITFSHRKIHIEPSFLLFPC